MHTCSLAQVITTLSPTESVFLFSFFPRRCHRNLPSAAPSQTLIETNTCSRISWTGLCSFSRCRDPTRSAHPERISHTNTHLSRRSNPLHHGHGWSLSLNVPPRLERTNKSSDLPLICSLASAWATVKPVHQGQALRRGGSISTAFCSYRGAAGTGQRHALQLEMETWGLCP